MRVETKSLLQIICLLGLTTVGAWAQTTDVTVDFNVDYVIAGSGSTYNGTGTVGPFGTARLSATLQGISPVSVTLTFSSGDSFQAGGTPTVGGGDGCLLPLTITAGTGMFANAKGTLNLTYACSSSLNTSGTFRLHGSGTITLTPAGPAILIDPAGINFSFTSGSAAMTQSIIVANRSNQAQSFTAAAATNSGGNWLSVSSASGSDGPFVTSSVLVTANPAGLAAGTYSGQVSITTSPAGVSATIPVLITVSSSQQSILLSQTGLFFAAVQGGGNPPGQSISVLNGGSGSLNFSASSSTLFGGNWLSVSPSSGSATATSAGAVGVTVNAAGLAPGAYYGLIQIGSPEAANSPQMATVVLNVSSPAQSPGPSLSATGLIFVASAGGSAPVAQSVTVTNPSPNPLTFATTQSFDNGATFFTVQPSSGTVTASQSQRITIQPTLTGLKAGVYTGEVTITFSDASTTPPTALQRRVAIVLIVTPTGASTAARDLAGAPVAGCTPTKLVPVFTLVGNNFQVSAGWPTSLEVTVVDDCGTFLITGSVVTTFSSGDPALSLVSLKNGRWTGTWQGRSTTSQSTVITAQARQTQPPLQGTAQIGGQLNANPSVPIISAGGVVSAASSAPRQPLGPGSYIAIFGTNLSKGSNSAQALPLPTQLAGTQVILGGKMLPLNFAGSGQINAIVPFDVAVNTTQQLIVQQGTALSVPEPVVLSTAQPAVFTQDQSGKGLGVIVGYKADGSGSFLVDAAHPVSAGDTLVIYCTGLGTVDQAVAAGSAGPSSPLAKAVNPVTLTVGGKDAAVSYAGLAPGLAVYQVNAVVPDGVAPGTDVPLLISVAGQQSVAVTIAVK